MLEHIMYSSIMAHLDRHKILSEFQHGFRKQRSCETQLLLTIHDFTATNWMQLFWIFQKHSTGCHTSVYV